MYEYITRERECVCGVCVRKQASKGTERQTDEQSNEQKDKVTHGDMYRTGDPAGNRAFDH